LRGSALPTVSPSSRDFWYAAHTAFDNTVRSAGFLVRFARNDVVRLHELPFEQSPDHRFCHYASAYKGD
jgi:hypothetical protein